MANSEERRRLGSWYTPPALIEQMLDLLTSDGWPIGPTSDEMRILDPSCGDGRLLLAVKQRVPRRCSLVGCDVNPQTRESNEAHDIEFVEGNGLDIDWAAFHCEHGFDLVISNPPFLSQLSTSTTRKGASKRGGGPYANSAMEFCLAGVEALRPGGRLAIVLPQSVLASRDTAELRSRVTSLATPVTSWWSSSPQFDADVTVAVLIFERRKTSAVGSDAPWTSAITTALGIPPIPTLDTSGVVSDRATATANFRDEYYALVPAVSDHHDGPPLVTSGLIDPGLCLWGTHPVRFAHQLFAAPRVDVALLTGRFNEWAHKMLRPKVLVAAQTRTIEAVADKKGEWLPGVPVTTVIPSEVDDLLPLTAVINSPIAALIAWHERAGTGLSPTSLRLSPTSILELPWPQHRFNAEVVSQLARGGQHAFGIEMCAAFGVTGDEAERITAWWRAAGQPRRKRASPIGKNPSSVD